MRWIISKAALGLLMSTPAFAASSSGGAEERHLEAGRNLALNECSICHTVSPDQKFAVIINPAAPDFHAIADDPKATPEYLRNFLVTTHMTVTNTSNMPNPRLTGEEVTDVVSFIISLRSKG